MPQRFAKKNECSYQIHHYYSPSYIWLHAYSLSPHTRRQPHTLNIISSFVPCTLLSISPRHPRLLYPCGDLCGSDEFGDKEHSYFHSRNVARHALGGVATCSLKGAAPVHWPHSAPMEGSAPKLVPWYIELQPPVGRYTERFLHINSRFRLQISITASQ